MRHAAPNGDPAIILERALAVLLAQLQRVRAGAVERPGAATVVNKDNRYIPAAVKRTVWQRDNGRCAFVGTRGRCTETGFLEYHHVVPFSDGGETATHNLQLRCRAHNQYEADLWTGTVLDAREDRALYCI